MVGGYWDTGNFTGLVTPSGYSNVVNVGNQPQAWCQKTITPAGATGINTYTSNEVTPRLGFSYAIRDLSSLGRGGGLSLRGIG